jgi:hypothetical protein
MNISRVTTDRHKLSDLPSTTGPTLEVVLRLHILSLHMRLAERPEHFNNTLINNSKKATYHHQHHHHKASEFRYISLHNLQEEEKYFESTSTVSQSNVATRKKFTSQYRVHSQSFKKRTAFDRLIRNAVAKKVGERWDMRRERIETVTFYSTQVPNFIRQRTELS